MLSVQLPSLESSVHRKVLVGRATPRLLKSTVIRLCLHSIATVTTRFECYYYVPLGDLAQELAHGR